ncbi:hypothetical protein D7Z26_22170 [Cohnella endophytica]|uniref:Uncharacterized protein n=2 Tax=Cohnella endophytica TaxID=2419778 RepID=A0A494XB73_9BACL|nr:hypothetical protein D7Z26_22170 [Cohnella endophytica]
MGLTMTGGWLVADLLLPEPWGDYLLYAAMAVVNVMVGWRLATLTEQQERGTSAPPTADARSTITYEPEA